MMRILRYPLLAAAILAVNSACRAERPSAEEYLFPANVGIYVGVCYYPQHWSEERWESDPQMMQYAGFIVVRVAEFAWVLFEPEEGRYDFTWLDRWLMLAEKYDMRVILGTPTAIMPAWLAKKYPEALEKRWPYWRTAWGGRRHNCYSDDDFRRLSEGIARAIAKHYADHPHVIGWQTDNEFGDGVAWYVGTIVDDEKFYDKLIASILKDAQIQPLVQPPPGVEVAVRQNAERGLLFLINHTEEYQTVAVPSGSRELLTDAETSDSLQLTPFGVAVVELPVATYDGADE